jgi:hypothetical protein
LFYKSLLNQSSNGRRPAPCPAFADLTIQFFRQVFRNADADNSTVARSVFCHTFNPMAAFNK